MRVERAWNPVALCHDPVITEVADWLSPNQIIAANCLVFRRPVMCMVNGVFWSRKDWDCIVPAGGMVRFVELPMGGGDSNPLRLLATLALMAISYYLPGAIGLTGFAGSLMSAAIMIGGSLLLNMLFPVESPKSSDYGTPKTVYSISSNSNRLRIGEPFAEHFGRMLCYPDLVQVSYTTISDNEMYLYFLGIVGVGEYEIEDVFIGLTPMGDYSEAEYNIVAPGGDLTLIKNVVWPSKEISGQELTTDYLTAIVSGPGTTAYYLEYDVFFRQLVAFNDEGDKKTASVTVVAEVRTVNYRGIATSSWTQLYSKTYSEASIDPLRYSHKIPSPLGPGRYEFRIKRTTEKNDSGKVSDAVSVIGLRAYGGPHPDYGDVTLIEAKIKATNQLNGDVANKINVIATRKLNLLEDAGFSTAKFGTRSVVDAIAYIATSVNGGGQQDSFLRFDLLSELKDHLDNTLDDNFDWRFQARTTVMDACVKAAKCGRSSTWASIVRISPTRRAPER